MDEKNEKLQTLEEIPTQQINQEQPTMEQTQIPEPEAPEAAQAPAAEVSAQEEAPAQEESTAKEETAAKEEAPAQPEAAAKQEPAASQAPKRIAIEQTQAFKPVRQAAKAVTDATVVIPTAKEAAQDAAQAPQKAAEVSYFDGSTWAYLGWMALAGLITLVTLGIGLAWAQCMVWRYRAKHTVVCGRRLTFDGTGLQLFENYLVWGTLTVFTLGIFGLWVPFKVRSWYCGHLYMTGFRRRHSQAKAPAWRSILVLLAAVLCFAALLIGIILIATGNAPWQEGNRGSIQPPPPSSTMGETAPPITTPAPTTPPETTPEPTTTPLFTTPAPTQPKTYTVTARGNLNLRANPSTNAKVLLAIPYRTVVTVEEWAGSWAKVTYNGETGWVSADYLQEN